MKHLKEVERLRKIIEAFPKVTVTVLGDLVADEFVYGEISRVSREFSSIVSVLWCRAVGRMRSTIWRTWE